MNIRRFFRRLRRKILVYGIHGTWKQRFHRCPACGEPVPNEWEGMSMPHTFQSIHEEFCEGREMSTEEAIADLRTRLKKLEEEGHLQ